MFGKSIAALAALSLAVSPAVAQSAASSVDRAVVAQQDSNELVGRGAPAGVSPWLIGVGVLAAILAILALTDTWPFDEDEVVSP